MLVTRKFIYIVRRLLITRVLEDVSLVIPDVYIPTTGISLRDILDTSNCLLLKLHVEAAGC